MTAASNGKAGEIFTANVATATGAPVTGGSVDFVLPNGQSLGSAVVNASGVATLTVTSLPSGTTTSVAGSAQLEVVAQYNAPAVTGEGAGFAASVSPEASVATPLATTVAPDFTVTGNPTTLTVQAGAYGTTAITIASVGGFSGSMQFSCSNLPAQVTCSFNPTLQTLTANGTFTSTLEIQTQTASGQNVSTITPHNSTIAMAFALPGALLLLGFSRRRLRTAQWLAVAFLVTGATFGLTGCAQRYGYTHHPPLVAGGTGAGTYTINVTVDGDQVSTATEHTIPITLVVQ